MLKVWDNGGTNIKLNQAKFTDMSPLSKDSVFNGTAQRVLKDYGSLVD